MDSNPIPATVGAIKPSERAIVRGQRLVQVKFVAFRPDEKTVPGTVSDPARARAVCSLLLRVFGRLVAARP